MGRAGRNGNQACAVLLTNKSEIKSCTDSSLVDFVSLKENCRRKTLLKGLNSNEVITPNSNCCDICGTPPHNLTFINPIKAKRVPTTKAVRTVPKQAVEILKQRLLAERKHIICQSGPLKALGGVLICPISCIDEIC